MRIRISHATCYRYDAPVRSVIQVLRLTPGDHNGQHTLSWRIDPDIDGRLRSEKDGLGNTVHVFSAEGPLASLSLKVAGEVETVDTAGIVAGAVERVPEMFYLRDTALTAADAALREFAHDATAGARTDVLDKLHRLLAAVHDTMAYEEGTTEVGTTAAAAFAARRGVCQDLAHVFIAAARQLGIPARYVSGYMYREDTVDQEAGHAWAEGRVPGLGWVGFDPANCVSPTEAHVRIATGLDALGAAPVRGSRRGGGSERLDVALRVDTARR